MGCFINEPEKEPIEYDFTLNPNGCERNEIFKDTWLRENAVEIDVDDAENFKWMNTSKRLLIRVYMFGFSALGVLFNKNEFKRAYAPLAMGVDSRKYKFYIAETDDIRKVSKDFVAKYEKLM